MGIDRTYAKIDEADVVLWLIDLTDYKNQYTTLSHTLLPASEGKNLVILLNKQDLVDTDVLTQAKEYIQEQMGTQKHPFTLLTLCAQNHDGLKDLHSLLSTTLSQLKQLRNKATGTIISNLRHYEALSSALTAIDRVIDGMQQGLSGDFISQDLRECIYHLSDIAGEVTTDEVLGNIFKHFCVGK